MQHEVGQHNNSKTKKFSSGERALIGLIIIVVIAGLWGLASFVSYLGSFNNGNLHNK